MRELPKPSTASLSAAASGLLDRRTMEVGGAIPDLDHFERKEFFDDISLIQRTGRGRAPAQSPYRSGA